MFFIRKYHHLRSLSKQPDLCQVPDVDILIIAYDFYSAVSCYFAEGAEFMTKIEIYDAIKKEYTNLVENPDTGGYWTYFSKSPLGGLRKDGVIYIVDTKDNTASLPGIMESKSRLSNFTGKWRKGRHDFI